MFHIGKFFQREIKIVKLNEYARKSGICGHPPAPFTTYTMRCNDKTYQNQ